MKTLKKTLCLVLAVVMVVGVLILPASAATYEDDAEITHKEAVEVLTGLKVLSGDADGFRPTDTLNRAEAAAVISRMLQTCAVADKFSSTNTGFTDCEASNVSWAKRYIAYCVNQGIIAGTEKGFEPARDVTGHEYAKMLLCSIGYDAAESGFYGAQWDINVELAARKIGLVDNLSSDFDFTAPISRDDVAQMTFDAMQYWTIGTGTGTYKLTVKPGTSWSNDTILAALSEETFASKTELLLAVSAAFEGVTDVPKLETHYTITEVKVNTNSIFHTVYNGYSYVNTTDAFKRPVKVWSDIYGNNEVDIFAEPIATFQGGVSSGSLYVSLGRKREATVDLYVDGKSDTTSMPNGIASLHYTEAVGGPGSEVYVYLTGANSYKVCVVNTYVGTISNHIPATLDANGNIVSTAKERVEVTSLGTAVGTLAGAFNTTAFTDLDAILGTTVYYTASYNASTDNYTLQTVVAAPSFVGTMTSFNETGNSYVINGTNYSRNYKAPAITGAAGKLYTFWTDNHGLIISAEQVIPDDNYAVLTRFALVSPTTSGAIGSEAAKYLQAELVMFDGSVKVVTVSTIKRQDGTVYAATAGVSGATQLEDADTITNPTTGDTNKVIKYTVNNDNIYAIEVPEQTVTKDNATIGATGAFDGTNVADSRTKFIIRTGADQAHFAYSVVTGYANLPTGLAASSIKVTGVKSGNIATFVYLSGVVSTTSSQNRVVFVTGAPTYYVADGVNSYYEYPVVENGAVGTIKVSTTATITTGTPGGLFTGGDSDKFYTITSVNSANGYVTAASKTNADTTHVTTIDGAAGNDVINLTSGGYKDYNANTVVYLITGNTVEKVDITALRSGWTVYVTYARVGSTETNLITTIVAVRG